MPRVPPSLAQPTEHPHHPLMEDCTHQDTDTRKGRRCKRLLAMKEIAQTSDISLGFPEDFAATSMDRNISHPETLLSKKSRTSKRMLSIHQMITNPYFNTEGEQDLTYTPDENVCLPSTPLRRTGRKSERILAIKQMARNHTYDDACTQQFSPRIPLSEICQNTISQPFNVSHESVNNPSIQLKGKLSNNVLLSLNNSQLSPHFPVNDGAGLTTPSSCIATDAQQLFESQLTNVLSSQCVPSKGTNGSTPFARHTQGRRQTLRNISNLAVNLNRQFDLAQCTDAENSDPHPHSVAISQNHVTCDIDQAECGTPNINCTSVIPHDYLDEGDADYVCSHCQSKMWFNERTKRSSTLSTLAFSLCCSQGKVQLPLLQGPPQYLHDLFFGKEFEVSKQFLANIRAYNMMFSFTSMGGKINKSINNISGPYAFVLSGQNYHHIGSLLPVEGCTPRFSQLYIYDTDNEVNNRISVVSSDHDRSRLDPEIVSNLSSMLNEFNPFVQTYRMTASRLHHCKDIKLRLIHKRQQDGRMFNLPTSSEVAALVVGDFDLNAAERDIIVETQSGGLQRISELHPSYLPLQYPLLFPYGEDGYREDISHRASSLHTTWKRTKVTIREFLAFRLMTRDHEVSTLLHARRLLQQFMVDGFTMIESQRLTYIRTHQKQLRVDLYKGLEDALLRGDSEARSTGKRVILPSSFTGGTRYMIQNYQDAMAICRWAGFPDLFLTFTCNPAWPEIRRFTHQNGLRPEDRPDILCRIFKLKLQQLLQVMKEKKFFGTVKADIYTIEFQKRGLPHAHILLFLANQDKYLTANDIDEIICAEIPDKSSDPLLYDLVKSFMMHGPCGLPNPKSPCMKDNKCTKYFPKRYANYTVLDDNSYPVYRRQDDARTIEKNGILLDNRFVVPYNPRLLKCFQSHLNVERCNQSRSIKYLFKYISKGTDRVIATLYECNDATTTQTHHDEIKRYYDCRYISACEASWRIFSFDIHHHFPPVERLSFHLPDQQAVIYQDTDSLQEILYKPRVQKSMFLAWMQANKEYPQAKELTYIEFPIHFVFNTQSRTWTPRKRGFSIGRLHYIPPNSGELYYLRLLLNKIRGPTCFNDIKKVGDTIHSTFQSACYELGLLHDDQEFISAIMEASSWAGGHYLRKLFASMLMCNSLSRPDIVWQKTSVILSEDLYFTQHQHPGNQVSISDQENAALLQIDKLLNINGKSLSQYPTMPTPVTSTILESENQLILEQLSYDKNELHDEFNRLFYSMNLEQRRAFDLIMDSISAGSSQIFFVHGYGGTGKTFLWNALTSALRSNREIVLTVASSGIAAVLLPGGRTAHSRFGIPIVTTEDSTCNIKQGSQLAELLRKTKLIIWDEAPMVHKHCFEALDRTLRDILQVDNPDSLNLPFGGKSLVMGGDFRQILPVIPKGNRADIVNSTINSSYLWEHCHVLTLTQNMRLQNNHLTSHVQSLQDFAAWIIKVGEGTIEEPNDGEVDITIPSDLLITGYSDPVVAIVSSTYPSLLDNLSSPEYLRDRAILAPTIEIVEKVNNFMLNLLPCEHQEYLSADTLCQTTEDLLSANQLYPTEFLNTINCSGLPPHRLRLKVGTPVMLLRNIDQSSGLCNGTRLLIDRLGKHILQATIITGTHVGQKVFIPRMNMSPSNVRFPFKLQRRQFPLLMSFAMTINKSQGQSLSNVGLYLPREVFTHGQLYVAISRVKSRSGLKILIHDTNNNPLTKTRNVVFKEVFENLH